MSYGAARLVSDGRMAPYRFCREMAEENEELRRKSRGVAPAEMSAETAARFKTIQDQLESVWSSPLAHIN